MNVYLLATLDTKGEEAAFIRDRLVARGVSVRLVDTGCLGTPACVADVDREQVMRMGGHSLAELVRRNDRGQAVAAAARGATAVVTEAHARHELAGVLGLGGSAGTTIASAAMRALPIGVPKVLISTLASGQVRPYVGDKDLLLLNSVVDIAGLNRISRPILHQAAEAMAGMALHPWQADTAQDRPLIAATMFGVTTPCVQHARRLLEAAGYEVLVFHATGTGGQAMESLIRDGLVCGVLDVTTTELADELVGGVLSAGPTRLSAAAERGIPQVVSVGATDMVNFGPRDTIPDRFAERLFYEHNATVTLMRTTPAENAELGRQIGQKLAAATGPTEIFLPARGVSAIDADDQPFHDPQARQQLFRELQSHCGPAPCHVRDEHINDPAFATAMAERLLALLQQPETTDGTL